MDNAASIVRKWIDIYSDGTPDSYGSDRFLELYAQNVQWCEMPGETFPEGRSGDRQAVRDAFLQACSFLRDRRVTLSELVAAADGRHAAFRYTFKAKLAVDMPPHAAGETVSLDVAAFLEVSDGLIVRLAEYHAAPRWSA